MTKNVVISAMNIANKPTHYFSQTARLGRDDSERYGKHVAVSTRTAPAMFTRTLVADATAKSVVTLQGDFNPHTWMIVIRQMMIEQNLSAKAIYDELKKVIFPLAARGPSWEKVIARSLGVTNSVIIKRNAVAAVPPVTVRAAIVDQLTVDDKQRPQFVNLLTDFFSSKLAKLGFLSEDAGLRVDYHPEGYHIGYTELVDAVYLYRIQSILHQLSVADVSLAERTVKHGDKDVTLTGFSIATLSTSLANACHFALTMVDETYVPEDIVATVLTHTNREMDPQCPATLRLPRRLAESVRIEEFTSNQAIFDAVNEFAMLQPAQRGNAAQAEDMIRNHFAEFSEIVAAVSHISTVPAADVAGRYGLALSWDHTGRPVSGVLYENWAKDTRVAAFSSVKHVAHKYRYLLADPAEAGAMSDALTAVMSTISMNRVVETRMSIYERSPLAARYAAAGKGAKIDVAMISSIVAEMERTADMNRVRDLTSIIANGCEPLTEYHSAVDEIDQEALLLRARRLSAMFFSALMHFAAHGLKNATLHIARVAADTAIGTEQNVVQDLPRLALVWEVRTTQVLPLGPTAIENGVVWTTEPIEAMLYEGEVEPTQTLSSAYHDIPSIADFDRAQFLHAWDWWSISNPLSVSTTYKTTVRGQSFSVNMSETDLLMTPVARDRVRFILPASARAMVRLWLEWYAADIKSVRAEMSRAKRDNDSATMIAADAHRRNLESAMIDTLRQIANTTMGKHISQKIVGTITAALYASATLDDRPDILVGAQAALRDIWIGVTILQFLALIDMEDARVLIAQMSSSDALAYRIGAVYNSVPSA